MVIIDKGLMISMLLTSKATSLVGLKCLFLACSDCMAFSKVAQANHLSASLNLRKTHISFQELKISSHKVHCSNSGSMFRLHSHACILQKTPDALIVSLSSLDVQIANKEEFFPISKDTCLSTRRNHGDP